MGWGSTKGRASLRAAEAPLYPRIKANAAQQHRNVCGAKESTARISVKRLLPAHVCHPPLLCILLRLLTRSDKDPVRTLTCTMPPAPSLENSSSCCSPTPGHNQPQICLLLCVCQWQRCQPGPIGLCSQQGETPGQARAGHSQGSSTTGPLCPF